MSAAIQPQRQLLDEGAFISHLRDSLRSLNHRLATNLICDENQALQAHRTSKKELEILPDSKNESDLFEAFDTFLDLVVENLIKEKAFLHAANPRHRTDGANSIHELIQIFDSILPPVMLMDNWLRSLVLFLTGRSIPSFFHNRNLEAIRNFCLAVEANIDEARYWRHAIGYPPLDRDSDYSA